MSQFSHFLCFFSGADAQLLRKCPPQEITKYSSQGVLIFLLTLTSSLSVLYSNFILHSISLNTLSFQDIVSSFILFLLWSFFVINCYRLLLASTGYGDNLDRITTHEFITFIPKSLLVIAISICSATAINICIFQNEINKSISSLQIRILEDYNHSVNNQFTETLDDIYQKQAENLTNIRSIKNRLANYPINSSEENHYEQATLMHELEQLNLDSQRLTEELQATHHQVNNLKKQYEKVILHSSNFLSALYKVFDQNPLPTTLIFLFILLIYTSPIITRLIWSKNCYEFLVDFQNHVNLSKYGIAPKAHEINLDGNRAYIDRYTVAEKILTNNIDSHLKIRNSIETEYYKKYHKTLATMEKGFYS